jgi:hypothetical protein
VSLFPPPENKPAAAPPQLATVAPPATKSKEPKATPPKAAAFTPPPGQLPYLFDQIKKPAYRASLNAVMADRVDLPPWVLAFVQTGNGVATPGRVVQLGSGSFELYSVRQPHNCWGNYLHVLYSPAGAKAWALVSQDGYLIAVLGDATPEQRQALFATAHH